MTPKIGAPPKQPDPVRMPSADDPDIIAAKRKKLMEDFSGRDGRAATQLTAAGTGGAHNRTTLG
jgi:hypothetical protein